MHEDEIISRAFGGKKVKRVPLNAPEYEYAKSRERPAPVTPEDVPAAPVAVEIVRVPWTWHLFVAPEPADASGAFVKAFLAEIAETPNLVAYRRVQPVNQPAHVVAEPMAPADLAHHLYRVIDEAARITDEEWQAICKSLPIDWHLRGGRLDALSYVRTVQRTYQQPERYGMLADSEKGKSTP